MLARHFSSVYCHWINWYKHVSLFKNDERFCLCTSSNKYATWSHQITTWFYRFADVSAAVVVFFKMILVCCQMLPRQTIHHGYQEIGRTLGLVSWLVLFSFDVYHFLIHFVAFDPFCCSLCVSREPVQLLTTQTQALRCYQSSHVTMELSTATLPLYRRRVLLAYTRASVPLFSSMPFM